jgi:hypothetical protein
MTLPDPLAFLWSLSAVATRAVDAQQGERVLHLCTQPSRKSREKQSEGYEARRYQPA